MTEIKQIRLEVLRLATDIANRQQLRDAEHVVDIAAKFEHYVEGGAEKDSPVVSSTSSVGEGAGKPAPAPRRKKGQPKRES